MVAGKTWLSLKALKDFKGDGDNGCFNLLPVKNFGEYLFFFKLLSYLEKFPDAFQP